MISPVCKAKPAVRRSDTRRSPQFLVQVRCTGPCLAPQGVEGWTGLEDMGWGPWTSVRYVLKIEYWHARAAFGTKKDKRNERVIGRCMAICQRSFFPVLEHKIFTEGDMFLLLLRSRPC